MQHSQGSGYGENLYMKWSSGTTTVTGQEAVDSWYNEIKDYNFAYGGFSGKTGRPLYVDPLLFGYLSYTTGPYT